MLLSNFVFITLGLTGLGAFLLTRPAIARRLASTHNGSQGYAYHGGEQLALRGAEALSGAIALRAVEMCHAAQRARLILRCAAPEALCTPEALTSWTAPLMRDVLDATGSHVVVLEVVSTPSQAIVAQLILAADARGWTGDRFDQVRQVTHLT